MATALILAGHGSHIRAETASVIWRCVDELRARGIADEVTAAFWKEQPSFSTVLDTVAADTVVVVPMFTAQGFFTQQVLPAEMELSGAVTRRGERTIYLTPPLGQHTFIQMIVRQRVQNAFNTYGISPDETTIAVIGHGTPRNSSSQVAARDQADKLRDAGFGSEVLVAYLDATPDIPSIYERTTARTIIAVPYFLTAGSHTMIDVPVALGLAPDTSEGIVQRRQVYYTPPVGTDDSLADLVLALARETGITFNVTASTPWDGFPQVGRVALLDALDKHKSVTLGELHLTTQRVTPTNLIDRPPTHTFELPGDLRAHLRRDPFRSLTTEHGLDCDWAVDIVSRRQLPAIVETVYPGVLADWAMSDQASPRTLNAVLARQVGMFKTLDVDTLDANKLAATVCGRCARQPIWLTGETAAIPCREACNHWLMAAYNSALITKSSDKSTKEVTE